MAPPTLHLHTYFRSSCSARVRTACSLKDIPLEYTYLHLLKQHQYDPSYTSRNPSASVPTLTVTTASGEEIIIGQSIAILEFLEEYFPDKKPLLPPREDIVGRARVRELVNIIANDVQPPTNLRILQRVKGMGGEEAQNAWAKELMERGLKAYNSLAEKYAGKYSVGDELTLADVVLAPAVEGAFRFGVDVEKMETVWRVYESIRVMDAFKKGDWKHQEDTPDEYRVRD